MPLLWGRDPSSERVGEACWEKVSRPSPIGERDPDTFAPT